MKQLILIWSMLFLLLFGAWGCSEKTEQPAETVGEKSTDTVETTQAGMGNAADAVKEKAKKAIEEMKVTTPSSTEETKQSE